ncbi:MAG: hypothetical protein HY318_20860 [Armatimonadetes bacterium]|nr:hypothetical protein [Armatimonadota bacterium]
MRVATLILDLVALTTKEMETLSQLPAEAAYRFDSDSLAGDTSASSFPAHKLAHRTVVSLHLSQFQSREVVRKQRKETETLWHPSPSWQR